MGTGSTKGVPLLSWTTSLEVRRYLFLYSNHHGLIRVHASPTDTLPRAALVLAPFFVHLELLFEIGYFPTLYKQVTNGVGKEILKFRQEAAAKSRKSS